MTNTELEALVQKLDDHGCKLLVEEAGNGFSASALNGMWKPYFQDSAIQASAPTLDAALALLADAVAEAEWVADRSETEPAPDAAPLHQFYAGAAFGSDSVTS